MTDRDDRIRRFVRSRADVPVPNDLRWPSADDDRRPRTAPAWIQRLGLGAAFLLLAVLVRQLMPDGDRAGNSSPTPSAPTASEPAAPTYPVIDGFPADVAGMPVVSVATAAELIQQGALDGRAVAVAGYFAEAVVSCPAPFEYVSPLVGWCGLIALADDPSSATLCHPGTNSTGCHEPRGIHLTPFFMPETSGQVPSLPNTKPVPVVLIGHAGDARQWQCAADAKPECSRAFVVDRVAWAGGRDLSIGRPQAVDQTTGEALHPRLTAEQAASAVNGNQVLSVAAFRRRDLSTIDPRWNLVGDGIVWIVRSAGAAEPKGPTRSVVVSLVDDVSGEVIDGHDLAIPASYEPARLWTIATAKGFDCCAGDLFPFFRVSAADGTPVHEGLVSGNVSGRRDVTKYGPGAPLLLDPGTYTVDVWLATFDHGVIGPASDSCSTQITLHALDDVMLDARYPAPGAPCVFRGPSAPDLSR